MKNTFCDEVTAKIETRSPESHDLGRPAPDREWLIFKELRSLKKSNPSSEGGICLQEKHDTNTEVWVHENDMK